MFAVQTHSQRATLQETRAIALFAEDELLRGYGPCLTDTATSSSLVYGVKPSDFLINQVALQSVDITANLF